MKNVPSGTYILNGGINGFANQMLYTSSNGNVYIANTYSNADTSFTWDSSLSDDGMLRYRCYLSSGERVSSLSFAPMIRVSTDNNDTFQPYAMTNQQLTESITPITESFTYDGCTFYIDFYPNYSVFYTTGATASAMSFSAWTSIGTVTNPYSKTGFGHIATNNGSLHKVSLLKTGEVRLITEITGTGSSLYIQDSCILR